MVKSRPRLLPLAASALIVVAACGSGEAPAGDTPAPGAGVSAAPATGAPPAQSAPPDAAPPGGGVQDPTGIDWATADLTTIDWATMDMSRVDWAVIGENPTARDLDAATLQLIQSRTNPGRATLTIGDDVWEFDGFVCAFGHENTESDTYSFTTDSRGEVDGVRVQMQATIADDSSTGRVEGSGTSHQISVNDISDFENPSVAWSLSGPDAIRIDGYDITAEGTFDDRLTPEREAIPGSLEATCGDMSRR